MYLLRLTPYVGTIQFEARRLEGSEGYWGKFYDVFDASFQDNLRKRLESERGKTAGDPWCIGYFVHNELSWGDDTSLAVAALVSPADQPAKTVFVNDLEAKYETIENLNQAWGTNHESWKALLESRQAPDKAKAREDLQEFYTQDRRDVFRHDPQGVEEGGSGSALPGLPIRLGERSGRTRRREVLRRRQLQPVRVRRRRASSCPTASTCR